MRVFRYFHVCDVCDVCVWFVCLGEEESAGVPGGVSVDSGTEGTDPLSSGSPWCWEDQYWTLRRQDPL